MNVDNYYLVIPASGIGKRMKSEIPKQTIKTKKENKINQ